MNETAKIQRGTRVHCILAHAGEGVVTAVREDPSAGKTYVIGLARHGAGAVDRPAPL